MTVEDGAYVTNNIIKTSMTMEEWLKFCDKETVNTIDTATCNDCKYQVVRKYLPVDETVVTP